MQHVLTLIADPEKDPLHRRTVEAVRTALDEAGARLGPTDWLAPETACDMPFDDLDPARVEAALRRAVALDGVDMVIQERQGRRKRLLLADMDSTMIENEILDEIAALAGIHDQVAPITEQAAHGEIDFAESFTQRVALLAGVSSADIARAGTAIRMSPGAKVLVATMRANGAYSVLITSGFPPFATDVGRRLGFDRVISNNIEIAEGRITGQVRRPILDRDAKGAALRRLAAARSVPLSETMAVGNGANDLAMVTMAGLGVAYRAKPLLREVADARIDHGDLTALLYIQGFRREDFVS